MANPGLRPPNGRAQLRAEFRALDEALYAAVAGTETPQLDRWLRPLTVAADHSKLWIATAACLGLVGGSRGRRAALDGMASVALASFAANQGAKRITQRRRPNRAESSVPRSRQVPMPTSTSFPSGHSASAFAFAVGVSRQLPWLGVPLLLAAATVGYTRVHAGVHYPGDVLAGAALGIACGESAPRAADRIRRRFG